MELSTGGRTVRWAVAWSFGEGQSDVCILKAEKWRAVVGVECARKYANQLSDADIAAVFEQAVLADGGSVIGEGHVQMEGGVVRIMVEKGENWGTFQVTLKVLEKGDLNEGELLLVVKSVLQKVRGILDGS